MSKANDISQNRMMLEAVKEKYFSKNIKFFERIRAFGERRQLNIFQKLIDDENEINAYSWLAEIEFGLCFDSFCDKMIFDSHINTKIKPDWVLIHNSQMIICEVLRLNTNQRSFEELLEWNKHVISYNKQNPDNPIIGREDSFSGSLEYFYGHQRKIEIKQEKFGEFCNTKHIPFILCIQSSEQTFLNQLDASDFFNTLPYGIFSTHDGIKRNVTGVLFRDYFGELHFYKNKFCEIKLNFKNEIIFDQIGVDYF